MTENCPKLMAGAKPQIQEAQKNSKQDKFF